MLQHELLTKSTDYTSSAGKPAAQLVPINPSPKGIKPPGAMRDQISIGDDFDLPLDGLFDGSLEPSRPAEP